jgi:uncharacterized membrane protein
MGLRLSSVQSRAPRAAALLLALATLFTPFAEAQRSGGRIGSTSSFSRPTSSTRSSSGSSWRSTSSSSGSGFRWGSSSSSRSSSRRSYSTSYSGGSSRSPWSDDDSHVSAGALFRLVLFVILAALILFFAVRYWLSQHKVDPEPSPYDFEVRRVSVGLDWSVRPAVQAALEQAASEIDASTEHGRLYVLQRVRDVLRAHLQGVRYAAFVSRRAAPEPAQEIFDSTAASLNARYDQNTISNQRRNAPPDVTARSEEGEGFVVVSVLVASSSALPTLPSWPSRESIDGALITIVPPSASALVGLEVVWSPSIDQDRLSSAELESLYPELVRVGTTPPGRVVCRHCRCVSAQELGECPSCGSKNRVAPPPMAPSAQVQPVTSAQTIPCPRCRKPVAHYEVQCQHCATRLRA